MSKTAWNILHALVERNPSWTYVSRGTALLLQEKGLIELRKHSKVDVEARLCQ